MLFDDKGRCNTGLTKHEVNHVSRYYFNLDKNDESLEKIYDRTSTRSKRKHSDIGFAVTRAGEIAGEHTVGFVGNNDEVQLIHKAKNRSIFVIGAVKAAKWIIDKKPGIYSMKNVLGF